MTGDDLKPYRFWLALLGAGLLLLFGGSALINCGRASAIARADDLRLEQSRLGETARRFQDDLQLAARADGVMNVAAVDRWLAPVDRLSVAAGLEHQAAAAGLANFTYSFAPATKPKTNLLDNDLLVESNLAVAADMPMDTDAYAFLQNLHRTLPGRVHLRHLSLVRLPGDVALTNIHMNADLVWLSNSTTKADGEQP